MFKLLKKVVIAAINVYRLETAYNLYCERKHLEADELVAQCEQVFRELPLKHLILKGLIKAALGQHKLCLEAFEAAWLAVDNDEDLNEAEKLYLWEYIYAGAKWSSKRIGQPLVNIKPISLANVPLAQVSKYWKRRYPHRDHPDWDRFGA